MIIKEIFFSNNICGLILPEAYHVLPWTLVHVTDSESDLQPVKVCPCRASAISEWGGASGRQWD